MTVRVKKSDPPESTEILAEAIVRLGGAVEKLSKDGGLNRRAIIILLQDATRLSKSDIAVVLDAIPRLKSWYLR